MRRFLSLLYIAIFTVLSAESAGPTASEILDRTSAAFQKAKTLAVEYTMTADGHKTKGNITISGDKFKLTSPEMTVWYDGKTQWTYNSDIREVNITEPTPEELADVNPFVIISSFRRNYNARIVKSAPNQYRLDLSPRGDSQQNIARAIITLDKSTYMPAEIALSVDGDHTLAIHILSIQQGKNYPVSTFVFNKNAYPKVEIVDLR